MTLGACNEKENIYFIGVYRLLSGFIGYYWIVSDYHRRCSKNLLSACIIFYRVLSSVIAVGAWFPRAFAQNALKPPKITPISQLCPKLLQKVSLIGPSGQKYPPNWLFGPNFLGPVAPNFFCCGTKMSTGWGLQSTPPGEGSNGDWLG